MKRIFIAIKSSKKFQTLISDWTRERESWPVRWIPKENLHITLVPPWKENNIGGIAARLKRIQGRIRPFDLEFAKIIYGPRPGNFRLIWAEGSEQKSLIELKREIDKIFNIQPVRRVFKPHLTLARFRPENFRFLPKKLDERVNFNERIESIEIMESILRPEGAVYAVLKSIKLFQ